MAFPIDTAMSKESFGLTYDFGKDAFVDKKGRVVVSATDIEENPEFWANVVGASAAAVGGAGGNGALSGGSYGGRGGAAGAPADLSSLIVTTSSALNVAVGSVDWSQICGSGVAEAFQRELLDPRTQLSDLVLRRTQPPAVEISGPDVEKTVREVEASSPQVPEHVPVPRRQFDL